MEAFFIRRERRSVEQQYGLRAFIGAGRLQPQRKAKNPVFISPTKNSHVALEITASGRERDINLLIGKISGNPGFERGPPWFQQGALPRELDYPYWML